MPTISQAKADYDLIADIAGILGDRPNYLADFFAEDPHVRRLRDLIKNILMHATRKRSLLDLTGGNRSWNSGIRIGFWPS